jgi:hypothetical protein
MDDKTRELRDIFIDVSGEETVTERQREERGSLADADDDTVRRRLRDLVGDLQDHHDFETDLPVDAYCTLIRGFYDGDDDAELAARLDVSEAVAVDARLDCHLFDDRDFDSPLADADLSRDDRVLAAEHDATTAAVAHYRRAVEAKAASQRVSRRFRDAFEELLTDADLAANMTEEVKDDGLDEAAEDIETDVSF